MGRPSKYSDEFRCDAVALYRSSGDRRTFAAIAKETGLSHEILRNWVRTVDAEPAAERALNAAERAELARLRKAEWSGGSRSRSCPGQRRIAEEMK